MNENIPEHTHIPVKITEYKELKKQTERVDELESYQQKYFSMKKIADELLYDKEFLKKQNKRYRELLKDVFNALENYLHVFTNESDLIESAEHLSKQIYDALESESEWD